MCQDPGQMLGYDDKRATVPPAPKGLEYLPLGPQWNVVFKESKWIEAGEWQRYDISGSHSAGHTNTPHPCS